MLRLYLETLYFTLFSYSAALLKHDPSAVDKALSVEHFMVQQALKMLAQETGIKQAPSLVRGQQVWDLRSREYLRILTGKMTERQLREVAAVAEAVRNSYLSQTAVQHALDLPQLPGLCDSAVPALSGYFTTAWELVPSQLTICQS